MKECIYKSYDELPVMLNVDMIAGLLGISVSGAYELMHEKGFPALKIGTRLVVPKYKFISWVDKQTGGDLSESQKDRQLSLAAAAQRHEK